MFPSLCMSLSLNAFGVVLRHNAPDCQSRIRQKAVYRVQSTEKYSDSADVKGKPLNQNPLSSYLSASNRLGISRHAPTKFTSRLCRRCLSHFALECRAVIAAMARQMRQCRAKRPTNLAVAWPEWLDFSGQILDDDLRFLSPSRVEKNGRVSPAWGRTVLSQ